MSFLRRQLFLGLFVLFFASQCSLAFPFSCDYCIAKIPFHEIHRCIKQALEWSEFAQRLDFKNRRLLEDSNLRCYFRYFTFKKPWREIADPKLWYGPCGVVEHCLKYDRCPCEMGNLLDSVDLVVNRIKNAVLAWKSALGNYDEVVGKVSFCGRPPVRHKVAEMLGVSPREVDSILEDILMHVDEIVRAVEPCLNIYFSDYRVSAGSYALRIRERESLASEEIKKEQCESVKFLPPLKPKNFKNGGLLSCEKSGFGSTITIRRKSIEDVKEEFDLEPGVGCLDFKCVTSLRELVDCILNGSLLPRLLTKQHSWVRYFVQFNPVNALDVLRTGEFFGAVRSCFEFEVEDLKSALLYILYVEVYRKILMGLIFSVLTDHLKENPTHGFDEAMELSGLAEAMKFGGVYKAVAIMTHPFRLGRVARFLISGCKGKGILGRKFCESISFEMFGDFYRVVFGSEGRHAPSFDVLEKIFHSYVN